MSRVRMGIVSGFLAVVAVAAVLGGTARPGRPPVPEPSTAPDLTATAEIRRSFIDSGGVAIAVTNRGDAPVRVLAVELLSDSFEPLGPQRFDTRLPVGEVPRDLQIQYGEAVCPNGIESSAAPASVLLTVETEDGAVHEVAVPLPHPDGTFDRLLLEGCAARLLAVSVDIELSDLVPVEDGTLRGSLELVPTGNTEVTAVGVRGSVLFELSAERLSGESLPIRFDAHRCEGHAVGDAKQPFAFTVFVEIGGSEPIAAPVPVSEAQRHDLYAMLDHRCEHSGG